MRGHKEPIKSEARHVTAAMPPTSRWGSDAKGDDRVELSKEAPAMVGDWPGRIRASRELHAR